jgi:hypothetical protein
MKTVTVRNKTEMMEVLKDLDTTFEDVAIKCKSTTILIKGSDNVHYPKERRRALARARGRLKSTSADAFKEV